MSDLVTATAQELAMGLRRRRWSAVEVLEAHLAQIRRRNGELNAIVLLDEEGARRRAQEADAALAKGELWGPLHGVPVTIKDTLETAGLRTTAGFPPLANHVPATDATAVARLRAAGAVLLGKTNVPLLAMNYQCDSPLLGRGNNPWNLDRTPGGSTGGGAAAVASGFSPLEIGSDIAGSVRIPAHYCGIYSLKPTEQRVSLAGHIPELPGAPRGVRHIGVLGPLARSVADLALALQLIAGPDGRFWETPPAPLTPAPVDKLRLAWTDDFAGLPITRDTREALARLATRLDQLGWPLERRSPDGFDPQQAWETQGAMLWCEIGSSMPPEVEAEWARQLGASPDSDDPILRGMATRINATLRQYTATLTARDALIGALERFFDRYDALLCPVTVGPAISHRPQGTPIEVDNQTVPYWMAGLALCSLFSVTGHPVVVLPLGRSADGLPIGLQVVGRRWDEMKLLAVAQAIDYVRA